MPNFGKNEEKLRLPRHIAIIMDGNGRWAKRRFLPRSAGHRAGAKTFQDIAHYANQIGVKYMTVYAFSTENWKRPKEEIDNLMNLMRDYLKDAKNFKEENIQVQFIGDLSVLPEDMQELIREDEELSASATGMHLNIAVNYGGRDEIVRAVRRLTEKVKAGEMQPADIDEQAVSRELYTAGQPDPDLIIRPSGEYRLSNYLIWQAAYAEFWFSDILWPDFKPKHLMQAIEAYNGRSRRFGGV
ncbi:MAG TPA: isoprenyl transferase [Firmicutes bacterium]|nr:isoprenyl transferase [Bacillota bacterium]